MGAEGRVLVTGASGFIGSALVPALEAAGHTVRHRQQGITAYLLPKDAVVHLACNTTGGDFKANVYAVAKATLDLDPGGRMVLASSLTVTRPRDLYDCEKAIAEQIVTSRLDVRGVILRLGHVYGPGVLSPRSSLNRMIRAATQGDAPELYGNAAGARDLIYIDDVLNAFVQSLDAAPGVYDVGTGVGATLIEAAQLVAEAAKTGWPVTGKLEEAVDLPVADVARFLPGWAPQVGLPEGIALTVAWLKEQQAETKVAA